MTCSKSNISFQGKNPAHERLAFMQSNRITGSQQSCLTDVYLKLLVVLLKALGANPMRSDFSLCNLHKIAEGKIASLINY